MTTDITELAQSLKAAAEKAIAEEGSTWWNEEQLASDYGLALHRTDAKFIALASHENVLALVEALERAQRANAAQDDHINQQQDRIEQPEKGNQYAGKRIAELESRTVTVKLLDCDLAAVQHMSGGSKDYCNGFVDGTQNAIRVMRSAGVDVREAE